MSSSAGSGNRSNVKGWLIPFIARSLIRTVTRTVRIRCEGYSLLGEIESSGRTAVLTFFHGRQFLLTGFFAGMKVGIMASLSRDGELQTRVMKGMGFEVVRGSASRGGARGFIGLSRLMKNGYHAAFAVDGPRGPIHEVKPGAIHMAKRSGAPVIALAASAKPAYIFSRTWDLYLFPLPFAKGAVVIGDPIYFDDDTSKAAVSRDCAILREELLRLQRRADEITGLKTGDQ